MMTMGNSIHKMKQFSVSDWAGSIFINLVCKAYIALQMGFLQNCLAVQLIVAKLHLSCR